MSSENQEQTYERNVQDVLSSMSLEEGVLAENSVPLLPHLAGVAPERSQHEDKNVGDREMESEDSDNELLISQELDTLAFLEDHFSKHSYGGLHCESGTLDRCPICWDSPTNEAKVIPCGHRFDLECIRMVMDKKNKANEPSYCPMCKEHMAELHFNDSDNGIPQIQHLVPILPPQRNWPDELSPAERSEYVAEYRRNFALEEARIRRMPNSWRIYPYARYLNICIQDGHWLVYVEREIELKIRQSGVKTVSTLELKVSLTYKLDSKENLEHVEVATDAESLEQYEKARAEIHREVAKHFIPGYQVLHPRLNILKLSTEDGQKATALNASSFVDIHNQQGLNMDTLSATNPCQEGFPRVKLERRMQIRERAVTIPASCTYDEAFNPNIGILVDTEQQREAGWQVMAQIQGAAEWFERRGEDPSGPSEIERSITNVYRPHIVGGKCTYCEGGHRNGNCLLIWDYISSNT